MKNIEFKVKIIMMWVLAAILLAVTIGWNRVLWNNGVCKKCGSPMVLTEVEYSSSGNSKSSSSTAHYIYSCENCHHNVNLTIDPNGIFGMIYD